MYSSVRREIPEFLESHLVYCDNLILSRKDKTCLLLTNQLILYEFRQKQLLRSIDVSKTILSESKENLKKYRGPKGKWFENYPKMNEDKRSIESQSYDDKKYMSDDTCKNTSEVPASQRKMEALKIIGGSPPSANGSDNHCQNSICFGKYIYNNLEVKRIYILIRCWHNLIVLERQAFDCFALIAEYENVRNFKLVNDAHIKFQSSVRIQFLDNSVICTNFLNNDAIEKQKTNRGVEIFEKRLTGIQEVNTKSKFKELLNYARATKAELQVHKATTQKSFEKLRQKYVCGKNVLRSLKIEEKHILTRCGDIWLRINASEELVIGIPLVNNCILPNTTIVSDLKPIFQLLSKRDESEESESYCKNSKNIDENNISIAEGLNYEYRLYHLKENFSMNFHNNLMDILQTVNNNASFNWHTNCDDYKLLPGQFGVLLIKIKIQEIVCGNKYHIFVLYHTSNRQADFLVDSNQHQQISIKTVDFEDIFQVDQPQKLLVNFHQNALQQDLLTILMTHIELKLSLQFSNSADSEFFEDLLKKIFDLEIVQIASQDEKAFSNNCNDNNDDDIDDLLPIENEGKNKPNEMENQVLLLFNRNPNSLWFRLLAIMNRNVCSDFNPNNPASNTHMTSAEHNTQSYLDSQSNHNDDLVLRCWKFYLKNKEKSLVFLKMLINDLISYKCNVKDIELASVLLNNKKVECNLIKGDNALISRLIDLKCALKQEIKLTLNSLNPKDEQNCNPDEFYERLFKLQYKTDRSLEQRQNQTHMGKPI